MPHSKAMVCFGLDLKLKRPMSKFVVTKMILVIEISNSLLYHGALNKVF